MSDLKRLMTALDCEPWATLSAIADFYEEMGEEKLAGAYRWFAASRKCPHFSGGIWKWRFRKKGGPNHHLPEDFRKAALLVYEREVRQYHFLHFDSLSKAYQWAAEVWAETPQSPNVARSPAEGQQAEESFPGGIWRWGE